MPLGSRLPFLRGASSVVQTTSGTTQATAAPMVADHVSIPAAGSGEGIILPPANASDWFTIANEDASSDNILVYPPVGSAFNGKTADTPLNLPANAAALFVFTSPTKIIAIFS
jgi:hypothetical protein